MRSRNKIHAFVIATGLLCALAAPFGGYSSSLHTGSNVGASPVDAWSGWRGLTAQGRADQLLPTRWSADRGIRWKTLIPGRGLSSPIVFGDRIYVTTAYTAMTGVLLQNALRLFTLGLLLALTALALRVVGHRCHPIRSPTIGDLVAAISVMAVVLVLAIIGCFGDALFDFAHSSMRAWMTSTVFASLCLALTAAGTDHGRPRLAIALSAMAFAAFALAAFPSPGYADRKSVV